MYGQYDTVTTYYISYWATYSASIKTKKSEMTKKQQSNNKETTKKHPELLSLIEKRPYRPYAISPSLELDPLVSTIHQDM